MPNLIERLAAAFNTKSRDTVQSYATGGVGRSNVRMSVLGYDPRGGPKMLRHFSRHNEWVRLAINYRRQQIAKASWKVIRVDDPKASPSPQVEKRVRDLFRFVNPKRESMENLLGQIIEDILVLDAGCIEKEKTYGGELLYLWPVDGGTIVPDPNWDGTDPKSIRYWQFVDSVLKAELRNDQLVYMMESESTYSAIGWSRVRTLLLSIEADLYGEQYDYDMLRQTAPNGLLDLGPGLSPQQVQEYREFWDEEIAGNKAVAIFGGGEFGQSGRGVSFTPFNFSNREQQRAEYKEWLVKKIAAVFEIDKALFNITGQVNRSTSRTQQDHTDEGLEALADILERYITREIIWEIDENHGFKFDSLNDRDLSKQAEIDSTYVGAGIWTINLVLARQGEDPVPWGDAPYVPAIGPVSPEVPPSQQEVMQHQADQAAAQQAHDDAQADKDRESNAKKPPDGKHWQGCRSNRGLNADDCTCVEIYDRWRSGGKTVAPFVLNAAKEAARMRSERLRYLNDFAE